MLYKDLTLGGNVAEYKKENELLHVTVKPMPLNDKVETFSIQFADITANKTNIELNWEKTRVAIKVESDIDSRIMKNIEANVVKDNRPYFQAASYYYENDKDLAKALEWTDKAIANNPKAYWMVMLKAKIQAKQKDSKGAVATAEQVIALATEDKNDDYVSMAKKLIAENKK
jgi:lipopolysaccharide biosynthesis regulator YciM